MYWLNSVVENFGRVNTGRGEGGGGADMTYTGEMKQRHKNGYQQQPTLQCFCPPGNSCSLSNCSNISRTIEYSEIDGV